MVPPRVALARDPGRMKHGSVGAAPEGVYPPREDTALLLPFARARPGERVLEIGSGAGEASLLAARRGARVVATDRNRTALAWLRGRALAEGLAVEVVRADLARGLARFDRVLANPPYLPTPAGAPDPDPGDRLALDGGPDGARVTVRLLDELPEHLAPGGRAYLLVSSVQSARALEGARRAWEARGGRQREVAHRHLEGERLAVWELAMARTRASRPGRGAGRSPRRTGARRRSRPPRPGESSRGPGRGRTRAPGAASGRRRSPPGS